MRRSRFDTFNSFLRKRRRLIIALWVIAVLLAATQIPAFFNAVSYNIANTNVGGPSDTQSQHAQDVLNAEFPSTNDSGNNGILVVIQSTDAYSNGLKTAVLALNGSLTSDPRLAHNFTGMSSVYSTESSFLESILPSLVSQVAQLNSSVRSINSGAHQLFQTDYLFEQGITGINQTAQLVYGVPSGFLLVWTRALTGCGGSVGCANSAANQTVFKQVAGDAQSLAYYRAFLGSWNSSFASQPNPTSPSPLAREQAAVTQAVAVISNSPALPGQEVQTLKAVAGGLNATDWDEKNAVGNLTVATLRPQVPANLSSSLGVSLNDLVARLIALGPSPTNATLGSFTIELFAQSIPQSNSSAQSGAGGLSTSQLVNGSYGLGAAPTPKQAWALASALVANATAASFSGAPLFKVNATSLGSVLSSTGGAGSTAIAASIRGAVANLPYHDYPFALSRSLTQNFVSADNTTMLVVFNLSSAPSSAVIAAVRADVENSSLATMSGTKYYVTGSAVLSQDVSDVFKPAVGVTLVPGVLASLAIVALLLLAPLAAIVPIVVGGIAIAAALPVIYYGIVVVGHGTLTFLTPTLTILLTLGLAVDYTVLQLRRTREERLKGKSTEDSVSVSVRWAGEAVLTAGITVVVAYIVMAVANVPLFNDVGTAIAISVSILIAAALTLVPSLELTLKDRLFWPGLRLRNAEVAQRKTESRVRRLADRTMRRKVAVAVIMASLALGAFYIAESTPTGADTLKLVPNFPSNQGLTVLTDSFGSFVTGPTVILVTTATPITYGHDQFNDTLLSQIETISSTVASTSGVSAVTDPTRPFGSPFNYSGLQQMPTAVRSQYIAGVLSMVGKDNKTAEIVVGFRSDPQSAAAVTTLLKVKADVGSLSLPKGVSVIYGGTTQATYESESFMNGILPEVVIVLAIAVCAILFIQLRSAFTPVRLVGTILCSVAFALALLVLIFYYYMALPILGFAPLFVVVTMLGVGIDYDIFFVTRIREEVLAGSRDEVAIKTALEKTWVTIFGLGLVLSTVFGSVLFTGIGLLQEIGFVVAAAVMIDVGLVILFFVPALMGLAERFNWWPAKIPGRGQRRDEDRASPAPDASPPPASTPG